MPSPTPPSDPTPAGQDEPLGGRHQRVAAGAIAAARHGVHRTLPPRYPAGYDFRKLFDDRVAPLLARAQTVLDVGSGRMPTYGPNERPDGCQYIGIDLTRHELEAAPAGSYDEYVVSDVTAFAPDLEGTIDLAISWQVLEHVKPLDGALENIRRYLRPGGHFVAQFSGTFGAFALLSRLVPRHVTPWMLERLFERPRQTTFPAYYDHCWASALERMSAGWSSFEVVPRHEGAGYFGFSRHLQAAYLAYEEWAWRTNRADLASYYLIIGQR